LFRAPYLLVGTSLLAPAHLYLAGHGLDDGQRATGRNPDLGAVSNCGASWTPECRAAPDSAVDGYYLHGCRWCHCLFLDLVWPPLLPSVSRGERTERLVFGFSLPG